MADKINSGKIGGVDFSYNYNTKQYTVGGKTYDNAKDAGAAIKNSEGYNKGGETTYTTASGKKYTNQGEFANLGPNAAKRNTGGSSFVDPSVLQDQLMNQKGGNTNIADKWGSSAVQALDTYNKTYNQATDEAGNKVETATKKENEVTPTITRKATSTSTDEKGNFVSDYGDGSTTTTDVYGKTKVNKNFADTIEQARKQKAEEEAKSQASQEEYDPTETAYTSEDVAQLNDNLVDEYDTSVTDQQNEDLLAEALADEKTADAANTLVSELVSENLESDAADYDDVDSIVSRSTYTSRVIDDQPFDWGESREEPDYWEASRMWEQPAIYDKEIEEQEEKDKGPLTNKRERDTTRIGRHG